MAVELVGGRICTLGRWFWSSHAESKAGYVVLRVGNPAREDDRLSPRLMGESIVFKTTNKLSVTGVDLLQINNNTGYPREWSGNVFHIVVGALE